MYGWLHFSQVSNAEMLFVCMWGTCVITNQLKQKKLQKTNKMH